MEEGRRTGKPTGNRPLGKIRWEDNILKKYASIRGIGLIRLKIGIIGETL